MATDLTQNTFSSTYKDDWDKNDNYHRILFNSGRALQARELTQLQTIMQEEMARFGGNIFKEGSAVSLGKNHIDAEYQYVKLAAGSDLSGINVGDVYEGDTTGIKAEVLQVNDTTDTLYIAYIDGNNQINQTFQDGEDLNAQGHSGGNQTVFATSATGAGVKFTVGEGVFFIAGHFVHAVQQSLIVSPYSQDANVTVGFKVSEQIISVNDDSDLYDNQGDQINNASPGADRYQINLTLIDKADTTSTDMFIFLARIENGVIVQEVELNDSYDELDAYLATRTKEESGNYIVSPYNISYNTTTVDTSPDPQTNFLELHVDGGHAYVNGYRAVTSNTSLVIPKPQEFVLNEEEAVGASYGNYFLVNLDAGGLDLSSLDSLISSGTTPTHKTITFTGATGTCLLRGLEREGTNRLRAYVYNVELTAGTVAAITDLNFSGIQMPLAGTEGILYEAGSNNAFTKLTNNRPKTVKDNTISQIISRTVSFSTTTNTTHTLPSVGDGSYVDPSLWLLYDDDADAVDNTSVISTTEITGLAQNTAYKLLYYVQLDKVSSTSRQKVVSDNTASPLTTGLTTDPDTGEKYVNLGQYDIIEILSVKLTDVNGDDASGVFTLDNGQRDNYYTEGRLILNQEFNWSGNVYVTFKYFARSSASTDRFYSRDSYPVTIEYKDIPTHKTSNGEVIELRDHLDYRPDVAYGSNTVTNEFAFPRNGSNIITDVEYYLPRADKILVDESGNIQVLLGQQAVDPTFKKTPDNSLELYKVIMNPNTLDESDLQITPIEHKRWTMADISKLEAKLDRLSETTELSLLELESKMSKCEDINGDERPETGEHVDDGSDQSGSDTDNPDYGGCVDPDSKLFRPGFDEDNIRLIYDESLSQNVVLKGDNIYLDYEETTWIDQPDASESQKVNPYGFVDNVGCLELSPSSDEWKESKYDAAKSLGQSDKVDVKQAFLWNNWQWNWIGRANEDYLVDPVEDFIPSNAKYGAFGRKSLVERAQYFSNVGLIPNRFNSGGHVRRIIGRNSLRQIIGRRVIDVALIPWIRSRKVYFKAMGLKPNTLHKAFFDNSEVTTFCKKETFQRYASTEREDGNLYSYLTSSDGHPEGSSDLTSDANGTLEGSFYIPSTRPVIPVASSSSVARRKEVLAANSLRWRAGAREFKLLDTTTTSWMGAGSKAAATYTVAGAMPLSQRSVLSTRYLWRTHPFNQIQYNQPFNGNQIKAYIDAVPSGYVQQVEPHLAGGYGPSTSAVSPNAYTGDMSKIIYDYVGDNNLTYPYGSSFVLPYIYPQKPLAQSFTVDNQFGVVLTKVSLYFKTKETNTNIPVSVQIRPMNGNKPSDDEVIPGSCSFVNPTGVSISTDASVATDFIFEEPVYLNANTKYALVILSQSSAYEVFTATNNAYLLGAGGRKVTRQHSGDMYSPSSMRGNTPIRGRDITYKMTRAKFSPKDGLGNRSSGQSGGHNGSLILRNADIPSRLLENNPLKLTASSTLVYVTSPGHGLSVGDQVTIQDAVDTGGITALNLNLTNTSVVSVDARGFTYNAGAAASASDTIGGGNLVKCSRNIQYEIVSPYIETIIPPVSSTDVSGKLTAGRSLGDTSSITPAKYTKDITYTRMVPFMNHSYESPRVLANRNQEVVSMAGDRSAYIKVDLKSGNDYVSPIVDLQRASLVLVSNLLDDKTDRSIYTTDETEPSGGGSPSKIITTPISVAIPSVGFQLKFKHITPSQADFKLYYRTSLTSENIYEKRWALLDPEDALVKGTKQWSEVEFLGGGVGGTLDPFTKAQVKIVMTSTNTVFVPAIKDLKWKFLAT